jgi:hypothetical protein
VVLVVFFWRLFFLSLSYFLMHARLCPRPHYNNPEENLLERCRIGEFGALPLLKQKGGIASTLYECSWLACR